jgi:hypothetical protein
MAQEAARKGSQTHRERRRGPGPGPGPVERGWTWGPPWPTESPETGAQARSRATLFTSSSSKASRTGVHLTAIAGPAPSQWAVSRERPKRGLRKPGAVAKGSRSFRSRARSLAERRRHIGSKAKRQPSRRPTLATRTRGRGGEETQPSSSGSLSSPPQAAPPSAPNLDPFGRPPFLPPRRD